jgi:hypothetical protein
MPMKVRKIFTKVLVVLLAVIAAVLLLRAVLNFTTGKELERYLAKAKAEGVALKMKELVPDCPDGDNGAILWKAAEPLVRVENHEVHFPTEAGDSIFYWRPINAATKAALAPILERNRKAFELMAEAATKPCFVYKDWNDPAYVGRTINALPMIRLTRLLTIDAVVRAEAGDLKGALERCRAGMDFTRKALGDAPYQMNCLLALADMKLCLAGLNRVLSGREVDPVVLADWIKELDPRPWRAQFARWVSGERAVLFELFLDIINAVPDAMDSTTSFGQIRNRLFYWLVRPAVKSELVWTERHLERLQGTIDRPYFQVREKLIQQSREAEALPWYYKAVGSFLPEFHAAAMKEASLEARMLATRAGLACKIYKRKTGRYPENLEALVPDILPEVPIDPFIGKPLVFRIQDGELLIYSLGSNQKDDGGRMGPMTQLVMEKDDDWTWREKIAEGPKK